jgi:O-antigen/teichoic acid export membrane protein
LLRFAVRGIGLVSTLILVRLLDPADFGVVAMAMVVVAGIELFAAFGFDVTLIHNQQAGRNEYDTAWTIGALMGVASAIAIALLAYPVSRIYEEPRLVPVFQVLAIASVLDGLKNIGLVEFRKQLQLHKEFVFQVSVKIVSFVATVIAAFWLRSYWALVLGILVAQLATVSLSYAMQPYRPRICFASFKSIFSYSRWLFVNNLFVFLRLRLPDFIVGKIVGVTGLGLYTISYEISQLPTTELVAPVNRVLLPGMSKISHDSERLRDAFLRTSSTMAVLSLPTAAGLAVTAHLFTPIVLGEKWLDAIPLIKVLAIFGGITAVLSPIGTTLLAIGRPSLVALLSAGNLAIMLPAVYFATASYGVSGAANAMTLALTAFLPVYYTVAARRVGLGWKDVFGVFARPVVATAAMYWAVDSLFGASFATALNLSLAVLLGAVSYVSLVLLLWLMAGRPARSGESFLIEQLLQRLGRNARV